MWKLRKLVFGGLLLVALLCGYSQPAVSQTTDEQMTQLEEEIWNSLDNLKRNSTSLTEELEELRKLQKVSQATLTELESSLQNTLDAYNNLGQQLQSTRVDLQKKQKQVRKLTLILSILIIVFILIRVGTIILRAKGFHLPEIINILL